MIAELKLEKQAEFWLVTIVKWNSVKNVEGEAVLEVKKTQIGNSCI